MGGLVLFKIPNTAGNRSNSGKYVREPNTHIVCVAKDLSLTYLSAVNNKDRCQKSQEYQEAPMYYLLK